MIKYLISIEKGQLDDGQVYPGAEKDKCADIFLPHPNKSFSDTRSFPKAFYQNREHRNTFKSTTLEINCKFLVEFSSFYIRKSLVK